MSATGRHEREGTPTSDTPRAPTRGEAFRYWLRLGCISFGGPAGQIALMHRELVDEKRWIAEKRFLHALNFCMVLPGPEAQQLATYIGWLLHRTWGGIVAGGLFVLPSLVLLVGLSWLYMAYGDVPAVSGVLYGVKPAVVAIVLQAAWRIGSRTLKHPALWIVAALAFVAIFAFSVPFPVIILGAALVGYVGGRIAPAAFAVGGAHSAAGWRARTRGDRRRYADARACASALAAGCHSARRVPGAVVARARRRRRNAWLAIAPRTNGLVLHQGCVADIWRRICGASLCLSGCGGNVRLAHRHADDRRPRARRDDARSFDHGRHLRRLRRWLDQADLRSRIPWRLQALSPRAW